MTVGARRPTARSRRPRVQGADPAGGDPHPELEYLFRHALVQDAAYGSLLKQERRGLHRAVADALEQLYPERRSELAAMLAYHLERPARPNEAIAISSRPGSYGRWSATPSREAYSAFDRAADLLPPAGDTGR